MGNIPWMEFVVSVTAIIAINRFLVFQMGQPRIWMSMSRDGLMPKKFSEVHPKYKTPSFCDHYNRGSSWFTYFFTDKSFILDFTKYRNYFRICIGKRRYFIDACMKKKGSFNLPYVNLNTFSLFYFWEVSLVLLWQPQFFHDLWNISDEKLKKQGEFRLSIIIYIIINLILVVISYLKKFIFDSTFRIEFLLYLLTGMTHNNWFWFGSVVYHGIRNLFFYGKKQQIKFKNA